MKLVFYTTADWYDPDHVLDLVPENYDLLGENISLRLTGSLRDFGQHGARYRVTVEQVEVGDD